MNLKGQLTAVMGFSLIIVVLFLAIVLFSTIEPFKEALDDVRDTTFLNCKGTTTFNQTAFDNDENNKIAKLTRRPTCFITGIGMIWFVGVFTIALLVWLVSNWRKIK